MAGHTVLSTWFELPGADSRTATTHAVTPDDHFTVYNFTVEEFHAYFVAPSGTNGDAVDSSLFVHNMDRVCPYRLESGNGLPPGTHLQPDGIPQNAPPTSTGKLPDDRISAPPRKRGNAPIGDDGHSVELHHPTQTPNDKVQEMTRTDHLGGDNYSKNHSNTGQQPSQIDRNQADRQRKEYWSKQWDHGKWTNGQ